MAKIKASLKKVSKALTNMVTNRDQKSSKKLSSQRTRRYFT